MIATALIGWRELTSGAVTLGGRHFFLEVISLTPFWLVYFDGWRFEKEQ